MKNKIFVFSVFFLVVYVIFKNWFSFDTVSSGDFVYLYREAIAKLPVYPYLWDTWSGNGLGGNISFILALHTFYSVSAFVLHTLFRFDWGIIEKIVWFWPFLALSIFSSIHAFKKMFPQNPFWVVSSFIFTCNTYVLMLVGGGQLGVAMGYAFAPLVMLYFIHELTNCPKDMLVKTEIVTGLLLALQVLFDARMAYVTMAGVTMYYVIKICIGHERNDFKKTIPPILIAVMVHMFWLLPLVVVGKNPIAELGTAYSSSAAVTFLSFADFSHTISLLHPNWPGNIFGKVYFLQSKFLMIPLLAFTSLLFIGGKTIQKNQRILLHFFALIGLIGMFFAKGAHPPLGDVYLWFFEHIPGFIMFRDPSKFYLLIVLSYAVLIPFTLEQIGLLMEHLSKKTKRGVSLSAIYVFLFVLFVFYWGVAHREAILGQLGGTFVSHSVPDEYFHLKDYLSTHEKFSRVLWVPSRPQYGYYSDDKPSVSIETFGVASPSAFISWMKQADVDEQLRRFSVSDIVVPTDLFGTLFVADHMYDDAMRRAVVAALRANPSFVENDQFGDVAVFQMKKTYGHAFFSDTPEAPLQVQRITPTLYEVNLPVFQATRMLIFSESFDPNWELIIDGKYRAPIKTPDGIQMYKVQSSLSGRAILRYRLQISVLYGLAISFSVFVILIGYLVYNMYIWHKKLR